MRERRHWLRKVVAAAGAAGLLAAWTTVDTAPQSRPVFEMPTWPGYAGAHVEAPSSATPAATAVAGTTVAPPTTADGVGPVAPTVTTVVVTAASTVPTATTVPAETHGGNSVYCGPSIQIATKKTELLVRIVQQVKVDELRPPCETKYGRRSTGQKIFTGEGEITAQVVKDNRTMLALSVTNGWTYYVDDVRFLSEDPADVAAGFDAYADYLYSGAFGIELEDEPTTKTLITNLAVLDRLGAELARRNAAAGRTLALSAIVRPSVNYVIGSDIVVPALRAALGPNARFSIDAYTLDEAIWKQLMEKLFGIVEFTRAPGTNYDIQFTVPMSEWFSVGSGEPRSPEATADTVFAYLRIAAAYHDAGVTGIMLFTGFDADDNVFGDHFEKNLLESKVLAMVFDALERYEQLIAA